MEEILDHLIPMKPPLKKLGYSPHQPVCFFCCSINSMLQLTTQKFNMNTKNWLYVKWVTFSKAHLFWGHPAVSWFSWGCNDTSHLHLHGGLPAIHSSSVKTLRSNRSSNLVDKIEDQNPNRLDTWFFSLMRKYIIRTCYTTWCNIWCVNKYIYIYTL